MFETPIYLLQNTEKVRRNNDYYDAEFYHVGIGFMKAILRQTGFGMCFYRNKKGIQSLNFDSRYAYTKVLILCLL